ncbi:MaoC family dehydratase [Aquibaculum arenosum]|uniref:MaoC/PaaZ C-terminal domain-containing protein n=1 Tax=Aquibaculum arenosum TaxID=3032591 RepID=A0ABT5YQZ2_9PROT|nr:MaoC family dehydratase [Fodinicurvata sp. CAU 1616]MDF2096624.1 MaoC/PaaZ C-terminal domain-containing protein [Fodinicurvata sp. CAU 1616]
MTIDRDHLLALDIPEVRQSWGPDQAILYALGCGAGLDPLDEADLPFVYEEAAFSVLPSFGTVLGHPGFWARDLDSGIDWVRVVHGEQGFRLHRPLPASGEVRGKSRVVEVIDKGEGRGALVYVERRLTDPAGKLLATATQTLFCRGDGGFGGPSGPAAKPAPLPERAPDETVTLATSPQSALIYRLSGDRNPLHADPAVARKAGFEKPILHGLATFGIVCRALVRSLCPERPQALSAMDGRFSKPVYPGETIETDIWRLDEVGAYAFRARVGERVVLDNGRAAVATGD